MDDYFLNLTAKEFHTKYAANNELGCDRTKSITQLGVTGIPVAILGAIWLYGKRRRGQREQI